MSRIFNKMYIVTGGVKPTDKLSSYRFLMKSLLNEPLLKGVFFLWHSDALEVDTTGMRIEYDKYKANYWTCNSDIQLKDCKCRRIARVNGEWKYIDIDPFSGKVFDKMAGDGYHLVNSNWINTAD